MNEAEQMFKELDEVVDDAIDDSGDELLVLEFLDDWYSGRKMRLQELRKETGQ